MTTRPHIALLPIDLQRGFDYPPWAGRLDTAAASRAETCGRQLLAAWRARDWPILHVRHDSIHAASPLHPGHPGNAFRLGFEPQPGEPVIAKSVNCAFIGTDLELRLRRLGVVQVVLFGFTTDMCVSTTARVASNLGFSTTVVSDASFTFTLAAVGESSAEIPAAQIEAAHLATLHAEFAEVTTTKKLIDALPPVRHAAIQARHADHPLKEQHA